MLGKRMFRKLSLSVVAMMGLAAFFAGGAQAVAGEFKVLGSAALATGLSIAGSGLSGRFLIAPLNTEITCEFFTISNGSITSGPAGTALVQFLFKDCTVKSISPLETLSTCVISNGGANHHITITTIILSVLHNGTRYLLAEQDGSAPLAKIEFTKGIGCTLPNPVEVNGTAAFETSQTEVAAPTIKTFGNITNELLQTLLGDELKFGKNRTILDIGIGTWELTAGTHFNCTWGAV